MATVGTDVSHLDMCASRTVLIDSFVSFRSKFRSKHPKKSCPPQTKKVYNYKHANTKTHMLASGATLSLSQHLCQHLRQHFPYPNTFPIRIRSQPAQSSAHTAPTEHVRTHTPPTLPTTHPYPLTPSHPPTHTPCLWYLERTDSVCRTDAKEGVDHTLRHRFALLRFWRKVLYIFTTNHTRTNPPIQPTHPHTHTRQRHFAKSRIYLPLRKKCERQRESTRARMRVCVYVCVWGGGGRRGREGGGGVGSTRVPQRSSRLWQHCRRP
jgi:hypothetical protein